MTIENKNQEKATAPNITGNISAQNLYMNIPVKTTDMPVSYKNNR